ncbi:MAG: hypothetical protein AAF125_09555 [Chloroflexota bacterium]
MRRTHGQPILLATLAALLLAACGPQPTSSAFQATLPGTAVNAPVYTATPTVTPTLTPSETFTPSPTFTPTNTPSPTPMDTPTTTNTPTVTATPTVTPTLTPTLTPTQPLFTLTPVAANGNPPPVELGAPASAVLAGWSCGEAPCPEDIEGWTRYVRAPSGFSATHVGRVPGAPQQIVGGPDGAVYATIHRDGNPLDGAVVRLDGMTGEVTVYTDGLLSPVGLAFQPGTQVLYVSARASTDGPGAVYRLDGPGAAPVPVVTGLPCCWRAVDNQVNGMTFGPDGLLYLGVSALSDRSETTEGANPFGDVGEFEAAVLRVGPHNGGYEVYARGIRHPFDVSFDSTGVAYTVDSGVVTGPGDRLLRLTREGHYRWPYWRELGCADCPPTRRDITYTDALLPLANYTLPRGVLAYTGGQFPANIFDKVFVAQWHPNEAGDTPAVRLIDPTMIPTEPTELAAYVPPAFFVGPLRPIDVAQDADGALLVADAATGHIWRVAYTG